MNEASTERLKEYLAQLPPQSQALLMREFERALERGEDTAVANFVLGLLRQIVRGAQYDEDERPTRVEKAPDDLRGGATLKSRPSPTRRTKT